MSGGHVGSSVVVDELHHSGMQREVAVLVEFADGDVEPVGVPDQDDGVRGEGGVFADS